MSVYSNNRTQLGSYSGEEIVANESYTHQTGLLEMMIDNAQNDQAIFEGVLGNDFQEVAGVVEESTLIQESGFIDKVKEFLKSCWAKIKAIFHSFIAKINNVIIRDNKEFVNKYKKEVLAKDLSKMKYKWAEPKKVTIEGSNTIEGLRVDVLNTISEIKSGNTIDTIEEKISSGDLLDELLSNELPEGTTTASEFAKDFHDSHFEDTDTEEGLKSDRLMKIITLLTNSTAALKAVSKAQKDVDKMFSDLLKEVDKKRNETLKKVPSKDGDAAENAKNASTLKIQNLTYRVTQVMQTAALKAIGAETDACKFLIAQCRRVFAQAASFNPKSVKENAILVEAAGDAAEYEVLSSFADYSL